MSQCCITTSNLLQWAKNIRANKMRNDFWYYQITNFSKIAIAIKKRSYEPMCKMIQKLSKEVKSKTTLAIAKLEEQ